MMLQPDTEPPVRKGEASALEKTDEAVAQRFADGLCHYQNYYSKKLFNYYFSSIVDVDAGLRGLAHAHALERIPACGGCGLGVG